MSNTETEKINNFLNKSLLTDYETAIKNRAMLLDNQATKVRSDLLELDKLAQQTNGQIKEKQEALLTLTQQLQGVLQVVLDLAVLEEAVVEEKDLKSSLEEMTLDELEEKEAE